MRVLIVEDRPGDADGAQARLRLAGHQTVGCADPATGFPCRALVTGDRCPLESEPVDAMVLALLSAGGPPPPGLVCAARRHIPAVSLVGPAAEDDVDLVAAVEQVARLTPPGHADAARQAIQTSLERHGHGDARVDVSVVRTGGGLHVRIAPDRKLPAAVTHAAAVRALAAVRRIDPQASTIGVTVTS
jgi:hypothetical protein